MCPICDPFVLLVFVWVLGTFWNHEITCMVTWFWFERFLSQNWSEVLNFIFLAATNWFALIHPSSRLTGPSNNIIEGVEEPYDPRVQVYDDHPHHKRLLNPSGLGLTMGCKFCTIRFKDQVGLGSGFISSHFWTIIYLGPWHFVKNHMDHNPLPPLRLGLTHTTD
jgi:hypothetical protein